MSASLHSLPYQADPSSSSSAGFCARSRNAQAQADLRARRKAHLAELEASNSSLARQNEQLERERHHLQHQIHTLKGQVKTLKDSLGMRITSTTGMDSLLAAVDAERSKVKRLRSAIRNLAAVEAKDTDSEGEEVVTAPQHKRSRTSASLDSNEGAPSLSKHDAESVTTHTTSSSSPHTPPLTEVWQDDVLRRPLDMALPEVALKRPMSQGNPSTSHTNMLAPNVVPAWGQWPGGHSKVIHQSAGPTEDQDDMLSRFIDSFASNPSTVATSLDIHPSVLSYASPDRPMRGPFPSASIFLVLFCLCGWVCGGRGRKRAWGRDRWGVCTSGPARLEPSGPRLISPLSHPPSHAPPTIATTLSNTTGRVTLFSSPQAAANVLVPSLLIYSDILRL